MVINSGRKVKLYKRKTLHSLQNTKITENQRVRPVRNNPIACQPTHPYPFTYSGTAANLTSRTCIWGPASGR
jgi:hypothetical protein